MHCDYLLEMPDIQAVLNSTKQSFSMVLRTGYRSLPLSSEWRFSWSPYLFPLIKKKNIAKEKNNNMKPVFYLTPSMNADNFCLIV